ncbi:uncharacterized protein EKO05_0002518 [Ascochyta rabiei]|uniref:Outer membrane n=1 Tax=Didymella rabiei TaxID=5454 RepID=A0A163EMD7_DIDRA|nr:uncharacterized protein EKO05_0002518 [Ascochyta rabiei]KZM23778.1 outer membrane [Ascochyta rabiei]UPX11935.1 hypothetical protein EKO05_0002518 [Ascochyta rabiei]
MGEYEELVELGIEGVDKAVDKYHDRAFDKVGKHSPAWHRRHDGQQQQERKRNRNPQPSESSRANHESYRKDHETSRGHDERDSESDMYAPDRRQERDYQERRDVRYVSDETVYYRGPDAGAVVMRGSDPYNKARGYEVAPYQQPPYNSRREGYGQRGRPAPQRRRSSWSPQRSGRERGDSRRARSRSRSRSADKTHRIAVTVAGGLIGGLLGNQLEKGKKYDTAATLVGAVIGGIGAREIIEQWDKRKSRREDCDEKWDERYGDDRDRRRDDRR